MCTITFVSTHTHTHTLQFDGQLTPEELLREILAYIKPDAPLYAFESKRPAITSADEVREAFMARAEEQENPPEVRVPQNSSALFVCACLLVYVAACMAREEERSSSTYRGRGCCGVCIVCSFCICWCVYDLCVQT
jgi:hypothetical protein